MSAERKAKYDAQSAQEVSWLSIVGLTAQGLILNTGERMD